MECLIGTDGKTREEGSELNVNEGVERRKEKLRDWREDRVIENQI